MKEYNINDKLEVIVLDIILIFLFLLSVLLPILYTYPDLFNNLGYRLMYVLESLSLELIFTHDVIFIIFILILYLFFMYFPIYPKSNHWDLNYYGLSFYSTFKRGRYIINSITVILFTILFVLIKRRVFN